MNGKKENVRGALAASLGINVNAKRINGYLSSLRIGLEPDFILSFYDRMGCSEDRYSEQVVR